MFGKFVCIFEFEIGQIQGLAGEVFMQSAICQTTQRKRILDKSVPKAGVSSLWDHEALIAGIRCVD